MAENAQNILNKLKRKTMRLFPSPEARDSALEKLNRENLDDVQQIGEEKSDQFLREMNELGEGHDEFVKSLASSR